MKTLGIILLVVAGLCASTYFVSIYIDCYNESVLEIILILGGRNSFVRCNYNNSFYSLKTDGQRCTEWQSRVIMT